MLAMALLGSVAALSVSSGDCESIDFEALEQELEDEAHGAMSHAANQSDVDDLNGHDEAEMNLTRELEDFDTLVAETREILKQQKGPPPKLMRLCTRPDYCIFVGYMCTLLSSEKRQTAFTSAPEHPCTRGSPSALFRLSHSSYRTPGWYRTINSLFSFASAAQRLASSAAAQPSLVQLHDSEDDFVLNFLVAHGMQRTLEMFQVEWQGLPCTYTLQLTASASRSGGFFLMDLRTIESVSSVHSFSLTAGTCRTGTKTGCWIRVTLPLPQVSQQDYETVLQSRQCSLSTKGSGSRLISSKRSCRRAKKSRRQKGSPLLDSKEALC